MKKTPFDDITIAIFEASFNRNEVINKKLLLAFVEVLRVKYLNMYEASKIYWNSSDKTTQGNESQDAKVIIKEMISLNQKSVEAKTNYFSFIEELNRFGRIFANKYEKIIPDYYRIRFFRNKMVEHWDVYLDFLFHMEGIKIEVNKLVVPYHMGVWGGSTLEIKDLKEEFQKHNVSISRQWESSLNPNYSEDIYRALERIDQKLRKWNEKTGEGIPEDLVKGIFKYGFPTPIQDLEGYIERFVKWIELNYKEIISANDGNASNL